MDENKNFDGEQDKEEIAANEEPLDETEQQEIEPKADIPLEEEKNEEKFSLGREVFEWVQAIVVALVIAFALRTFVFTLVDVKGQSMEPTLHDGNKLVVTRLNYVPHDGDIIIFRPKVSPETPYVKRVIATAGQKVNIDFIAGKVFVDDKELTEPYIKALTRERGTTQFPAVVPPNCVFAMGDNRNNSRDSRFTEVGMIANDTIIGRAVYRLLPFNEFGNVQ